MIVFDECPPGALYFLKARIFRNTQDFVVIDAVNHESGPKTNWEVTRFLIAHLMLQQGEFENGSKRRSLARRKGEIL